MPSRPRSRACPRHYGGLYAAERVLGRRSGGDKGRRKGGLPDLGKLEDVADYMLDPSAAGYTSTSDTEADTDAEVEMAAPARQKVLSRRTRERPAR